MSKPQNPADDQPHQPRSYSAKEAAAALGISSNSFYAHAKLERIKVIRLGKKIIVLREEIDRILAEGREKAAAAKKPASPLD